MQSRYSGSALVTALLFLSLFSLLFFLLIEEYRLSHSFSRNTRDFYTAEIIVSMFLSEIKMGELGLEQGQRLYSEGQLSYFYRGDFLEITVTVNEKNYEFNETVVK